MTSWKIMTLSLLSPDVPGKVLKVYWQVEECCLTSFTNSKNTEIQVFGCCGNEEYTFCITILLFRANVFSLFCLRSDNPSWSQQIYKYLEANTRYKSKIRILICVNTVSIRLTNILSPEMGCDHFVAGANSYCYMR